MGTQTGCNEPYYENFKIECWDTSLNSLSVRQGPKLIEWLRNTYPDVKINVRPHMVMDHYIYIDWPRVYVHKHWNGLRTIKMLRGEVMALLNYKKPS